MGHVYKRTWNSMSHWISRAHEWSSAKDATMWSPLQVAKLASSVLLLRICCWLELKVYGILQLQEIYFFHQKPQTCAINPDGFKYAWPKTPPVNFCCYRDTVIFLKQVWYPEVWNMSFMSLCWFYERSWNLVLKYVVVWQMVRSCPPKSKLLLEP